jgi:hypothetical protein
MISTDQYVNLLSKYNKIQTSLKTCAVPVQLFRRHICTARVLIGFLIEFPKLLVTFLLYFNKNKKKKVLPDWYMICLQQCKIQRIHP